MPRLHSVPLQKSLYPDRGRGEKKETLTRHGRDAGQWLELGKQVNRGKISSVVVPLGRGVELAPGVVVVPGMVAAPWFDLVSQPLCAGLLIFLGPMHKTYF